MNVIVGQLMVHHLEIELTPPNEWGACLALIRVDGRPLIEVIKELEAPIAAAAGQPKLAGSYSYLNATDVLLPSRRLLGEVDREGGKVPVLECECGFAGCWPLLMRITVTKDSVVWSEPQQPHRKNWSYPSAWQLVFDRRQYEQALAMELGTP